MAVQSLPDNAPSLESERAEEQTPRGRLTMNQEKLAQHIVSADSRSQHASPSQKTALPRWRAKGKEKSSMELACTWVVEHQIGIAVNILSFLFMTHVCFPQARHHTQKFFSISYYNEKTDKFALGWDDICFVLFWIIVFTGMRCAVMDYLLTPLAAWAGIEKRKARIRFAEQAWILLYPGFFWTCGMYILYNSDYWLNFGNLWVNWPIREMDGLSKWYYLVQFAFWLQQIVVVNIEERRKDYAQMFTHHIITCALIFTSYGYHQTKVGNLFLCLMDLADIFLPLAKVLKYVGFTTLCDALFGVFMITWFVGRHAIYMMVVWSIYYDLPRLTDYGCYRGSFKNLEGPLPVPNDWDHLLQPFYDPEGLVCFNGGIRWVFLTLLLALQCVLIVWFVMIIKVAHKVLTGQRADDIRSDAEDSDEDEEELEETSELDDQKAFIEEEVGAESMRFSPSRKGKSSPSGRPRKIEGNAAATGVSLLPGDRRDLLGRIGCDKGT